jgi:hypothetical protein
METLEERRERIRKKAGRQFVALVFLILAMSAYIAYFTGDRFIEMSDQAPE